MELSLCPVKKIDCAVSSLIITWQDGEQRALPHRWLRENAPENYSPVIREELTDYYDSQETPSPRSVAVEYDETLVVSWAGRWEVTRHPLSYLREYPPPLESVELSLAAD